MRPLPSTALRWQRRLSFANVMSVIAVFLALGGTSYAVTRNSIGTPQIRDGAVTSAKVRNGTLEPADLSAALKGSLTRGPRGLQGPAGSAGPAGPVGPAGPSGVQGERGPSTARMAPAGGNVTLPSVAGQTTLVRRMDDVPAGSWLLRFEANAHGPGPGMYAICSLRVNGDEKALSAAVVGQDAHATQEVPIPVETVVTQASPFNVTVYCYQDQTASPAVIIVRAKIIALQVGQAIVTP